MGIDKKTLDAIDKVVKEIGKTIFEQIEIMEASGEHTKQEILSCFNIALSFSAAGAVLTLSKHFANYKTRDKYLQEFKKSICDMVESGAKLKEADLKTH